MSRADFVTAMIARS